MNTEQIKSEIRESIDDLPEGVLLELWEYLRQLNSAKSDEIRLATHLSRILKDDRKLLRRLAE